MKRTLTQCPVCDEPLTVTVLHCGECGTSVQGVFPVTNCSFCTLPDEQRNFLETFLRCRGNLRDVERSLGLSYPTVRARLDVMLNSLGYNTEGSEPAPTPEDRESRRREILEDLNTGRLTTDEAVRLLETLSEDGG